MRRLINLSLSLMITALIFASCTKSENTGTGDKDKGPEAVMTIKFDNPVNRSVGTPTNESTITEGTVLVFRAGSGILDGMATFTSVANPIEVKITAGTRDVYVIANTGIDFAPVRNVSDLTDYTSKYALSAISATGTSLPMSGSALSQDATTATLTNHATATTKGFGNTNPYEPITNAAMDVTIIPASWSPTININQTFS